MEPTIRQLKHLLALKAEESFSRAAEQCHVTQSTLSASIKELEFILGHTLVNRTKRQITLTPMGEDIASNAEQVIEQLTTLTTLAKQNEAPLTGTLRLGIIPTIAPYLLPSILPIITTEFPDLTLQIHEDLSNRLVDQLEKNHLDILLMAFPFETPCMHQHILYEEEFFAACPKGTKTKSTLSIHDLDPQTLLLLEDGHCLRDHALSACNIQIGSQSNSRKTFNATSLPTLIQMVGHGYGTTLLPEMVVKNAPLPKEIKTVKFKSPKPTRQIGLAWSNKNPGANDYPLLAETLSHRLQRR